MLTRSKASFPHRHNSDGSHDSICTTCFATVAKSNDELELDASETAHDCHPTVHYEATHRLKIQATSAA